jgi:hypothetical protein
MRWRPRQGPDEHVVECRGPQRSLDVAHRRRGWRAVKTDDVSAAHHEGPAVDLDEKQAATGIERNPLDDPQPLADLGPLDQPTHALVQRQPDQQQHHRERGDGLQHRPDDLARRQRGRRWLIGEPGRHGRR